MLLNALIDTFYLLLVFILILAMIFVIIIIIDILNYFVKLIFGVDLIELIKRKKNGLSDIQERDRQP